MGISKSTNQVNLALMSKSGKEYKVTYKTYPNERLKKVLFHTRLMHPLYVQVIFDRIPIIFKSYFFDLFSKPKYAIRISGRVFTPDIKEIIQKEEALIAFIIDKNIDNFSLDIFKKEYAFYGRDLLDLMETDFLDYLFTFLQDEGLPYFADILKHGATESKLYDLVRDFKLVFNPTTYQKLIENSFYYAPPYLALFAFSEKPKATPFICFTVMDWEQDGTKEKFIAFCKTRYPGLNVDEAIKQIQQRVFKK